MEEKELSLLVKSLYEKMAKVRDSMDRIPKNGYNSYHDYHYATEDDITTHLRQELKDNNLATSVSTKSIVFEENTAGKGKSYITTVNMIINVVDLDTGYKESFSWYGHGEDKGDKGIYKAYTGSIKYWLMKNFLLSTGDDPEKDDKDDPEKDEEKKGKKKNDVKKKRGDYEDAKKRIKDVANIKELESLKVYLNQFSWTQDEMTELSEMVKAKEHFFAQEVLDAQN